MDKLLQNIKNLVKRHNLNIQINLLKTQKEKLSQELKHEEGNHKDLNTKRA